MFDLNIEKILVLAVIAVVIFGPDQLPKIAVQAGRMLRELRRIADGARNDLREGLGPEFAEFDVADLNPRHFVQKHLLEGFDGGTGEPPVAGNGTVDGNGTAAVAGNGAAPTALLGPDEKPPFDAEAT